MQVNGAPILPPAPDKSDRLRRDLDAILQGLGVCVSGFQLDEIAEWFDSELDERAHRRRRARDRIKGHLRRRQGA
jgi:hypothetical protein